jgi:HSP20 family protein
MHPDFSSDNNRRVAGGTAELKAESSSSSARTKLMPCGYKTDFKHTWRSVMEIMKREPFGEMEDLFDRFSRPFGWSHRFGQELARVDEWAPRVDISETDKEFAINAEVPDIRKEDVKVNVENGILTFSGERKQEKEEKGKRFHRVERCYGSFSRSFALPDNVDEAKIDAKFKDGMLKLTLPKTETKKPKAIEVKVN